MIIFLFPNTYETTHEKVLTPPLPSTQLIDKLWRVNFSLTFKKIRGWQVYTTALRQTLRCNQKGDINNL